jgi:hypothetical protein
MICRSERPASNFAVNALACAVQGTGQRAADNDDSRGHAVNRVRKALSRQMRVDQGHGNADPRETEPDGHIFGTVGHQERDDISFNEALSQSPARIAVRIRGESPIAQSGPVGY